MYNSNTVVPAYGRDYRNKTDMLKDWNEGKDFRMEPQGYYVNNAQTDTLLQNGITHLKFRYSKLRKIFILKLEE